MRSQSRFVAIITYIPKSGDFFGLDFSLMIWHSSHFVKNCAS